MPRRSSKKEPKRPPSDVNQATARIVQLVSDDEVSRPSLASNAKSPASEKNPAAVALGRLGGKKGGKARAEKLTPEQRSEIARMAARKR
jgi:hypothetical protein